MTGNKVYEIQVKPIDNYNSRANLDQWRHIGRKITILSDAVKEPVYFHRNINFIATGYVIFLECSSTFLDRLKGEYFIESMNEFNKPGLITERSPEHHYIFENAAPPPAPVKKPKFGP
jgi:hypothetical protein